MVQRINPELLTAVEAMTYLGLSRTKFYEMLRAGELPSPVRLSPRNPRWPRDDLLEWVKSRRDVA